MVLSSSTKTPPPPPPSNDDTLSYEVLYYKRKNKVHKSKGVSKMDGRLTVSPAPSCQVQLFEDDGKTKVYSGLQRQVAKSATDGLQVDDTVVVGQYEVQIVSLLSSAKENTSAQSAGNASSTVAKTTTTTSTLQKRMVKPLISKKSKPLVKQPLTSSAAAPSLKPQASSARPSNKKPEWQQNRRPPAQPKKQSAHDDSSVESDSKDDDTAPVSTSTTRKLPPARPNSLFSRKRKLTSVARAPKANASDAASTSTSCQFPGAIGNVVVPPSVAKVLRPHQVQGVAFMWNCLTGQSPALQQAAKDAGTDGPVAGVILADEMGLGKTLMTIATMFALYRRQKEKRFVVVCPSSLVSNWAKEFDKWIGRASQPKRVVVRKGGETGLQQIRAFVPVKPNQSEVLIISYDLFRMSASVLNQAKNIGLLIVDEGHRLKNSAGSLTLTALNGLQCDARLLITGTPIQNNLTEFHTVASFVCPGLLGDLSSFRKEYERPISTANSKSASWEQRARGHAQSQALDKITSTFMLRRLQKDILKSLLPPRQEFLLFCRPSERQCELYKSIASKALSGGGTAEALTVLTSLRKLCSHPSLLDKNAPIDKDVSLAGKIQVLDALLQAIRQSNSDDKIVIVSNFTSALTVIEETVLKTRGLAYLRLDGTIAQSERQPLVDSFNRCTTNQAFAFLLSSKAGGCGLNLIGANRLVMFDADYNPATDMQAMARVYRQGQTKPCFIYRMFTSGTVEEVVYQRQIQKGNLATITVDGSSSAESSSARFTKEELRDCFKLKEDCACDTKRKVGTRWPEYAGAQDLESQDCNDTPLLTVAKNHPNSLRFVHQVSEEELVAPPEDDDAKMPASSTKDNDDDDDDDSDEECEFVDDECEDNKDSDEECEFDE